MQNQSVLNALSSRSRLFNMEDVARLSAVSRGVRSGVLSRKITALPDSIRMDDENDSLSIRLFYEVSPGVEGFVLLESVGHDDERMFSVQRVSYVKATVFVSDISDTDLEGKKTGTIVRLTTQNYERDGVIISIDRSFVSSNHSHRKRMCQTLFSMLRDSLAFVASHPDVASIKAEARLQDKKYKTAPSYDGFHSSSLRVGFEKALGDPSTVIHVNAADIDRIQDVEFGVIKRALSTLPRGGVRSDRKFVFSYPKQRAPRRSFERTRTIRQEGGGGTSSHPTRAAKSRPATAPVRRIKSTRAAAGTRRGKQ